MQIRILLRYAKNKDSRWIYVKDIIYRLSNDNGHYANGFNIAFFFWSALC
jgi:hypothetical protein